MSVKAKTGAVNGRLVLAFSVPQEVGTGSIGAVTAILISQRIKGRFCHALDSMRVPSRTREPRPHTTRSERMVVRRLCERQRSSTGQRPEM